jgi:hypothetical protein
VAVAAVKRTRLRSVSAKRAAARVWAEPLVQQVYDRDRCCILTGHQALAGQCLGRLTPHHLRKQGQGGPWTLTNIVALCARHNGWVENHPDLAHDMGLVIRTGETYADAWAAMRRAGIPAGAEIDPSTGGLL